VVAGAAVVKAVIGTLFGPAFSALVVDLVPGERLPRAQALLGTSGAIAGLIGQALAGLAYDQLGGVWLLAIDGASFLVSGLACTLLRLPEVARPVREHPCPPSLWRSGMAGLALVWRHPVLRRMQLANAVFGLVGIPCFVAMPALLRVVGGDGSWLGWTYAAGGVGGLLAGSIMQFHPRDRSRQVRIACLAGIACNIPYALMAFTLDPWQVAMASGLTGFFCSIGGATGGGLVLARIPRAWQGRFHAGSSVISRMLMPFGMLGGGAIADALGLHLVYGLGGGLSIALSLVLILDRRYRRFLRGGG